MRFPDVPSTSIKLMLFPFSLEGSARIWLEKEPPRSIMTWDICIPKFINQFFPPSKTTNLRNKIKIIQQRLPTNNLYGLGLIYDLLRACPHHGFSELHQLDTFYNALNANDQDSLNSAAGGNFLDKMPRECLRIIENGILCQRCSCGWCGNKLDDGFCSYCASKDGNSFAYNPNPNSFDNSPNFSYPPPQPQFETYSCELCGNDSHYGYDCPSRVPLVYEPEPCYNQNFSDNYYPQNSPSFSQQYLCCAYCGGPHYDYQCQPINETYYEPNPSYDYSGFDHPQPPQDSVDCQEALDKILEELKEIKRDRRKKIEDMSIEEMRHEQQLVDYKIKDITNDLGIKRFRGKEINEEYDRDCEIRIRELKQDFNEWGSEVRKKEQAYEEEQYATARRRMLSIPFVDEDDYIPLGDIITRYATSKAITPDEPIEEPDNSLSIGNEHLDTISAMESDEVIKSSIENLVPIPSEFEGISDDTSDVLTCDNNCVNVKSDLVESLINCDTSIVYSSKIDPILEEFAGELAHIALIPPGIVEADFDPNDDTSSDDDSFEDIEYVDASPSYSELVSLEKVNDVDQEEKEFDLEDILQIQDVNLHERLLKISLLISNIESLKDKPTLDRVFKSHSSFPIPVADSDSFFEETDTSLSHLDNSLPEFETFSNHTEETRSGRLTSVVISDNSNDLLLEIPEFESFHFDPSFPRPPPEPPDVEISLVIETDVPEINDFDELNGDECFDQGGGEINFEADDSFTFVTWTFLPFLTYLEVSPLLSSTKNEDTIFDPGIFT
ncbi:reverse transcriptase domain-containing protein [Tanacetum coccineum]